MIVAVYLFVLARLSGIESGPEDVNRTIDAALGALGSIIPVQGDKAQLDREDVHEWLRGISSGGWTTLDWFGNIQPGQGLGIPGIEDDSQSDVDEKVEGVQTLVSRATTRPKSTGKRTLLPGLGTMVRTLRDLAGAS